MTVELIEAIGKFIVQPIAVCGFLAFLAYMSFRMFRD